MKPGIDRAPPAALLVAAVALASATACSQPPAAGDAAAPALLHEAFHPFCPFQVVHPSTTLVSDDAQWRRLLAGSTASPAPYADLRVDFRTDRVAIVAWDATPTPMTAARLAAAPALVRDEAAVRLALKVERTLARPARGEVVAQVVGTPCLVVAVGGASAAGALRVQEP